MNGKDLGEGEDFLKDVLPLSKPLPLSKTQHGSMQCIMNGRNKTVALSIVILLTSGFHMPLTDFSDDEIFRSEKLELEPKKPPC